MPTNVLFSGSKPIVSSGLALVALLLLSPPANAATTYAVRQQAHEGYTPLPIEGGGPVVVPVWSNRNSTGVYHDEGVGSAWVDLAFPVRFFGATYDGVAARDGVLYFGTREETLCLDSETTPPSGPACASQGSKWRVAGPIPRELLYPNRLLALWWGGVARCEIRSQTLGEAPARSQVIQFVCADNEWMPADLVRMQAWFREGSSTIEVRYGLGAEALPTQTAHLFAGMMSPESDGVSGAAGLPCSRPGFSCRWSDYPQGKAITYSIPADLAAVSVAAGGFASPGVPLQVSARIENIGDEAASGAITRFYLSASGALDGSAIQLGETSAYDLQEGGAIEHELSLSLPADLGAGLYQIFAHADPLGVVAGEVNLANNLGASPPFLFGASSPLLSVIGLDTQTAAAEPAGSFEVELRVANEGSAAAEQIPFAVVLSRDEELGPMDRLLSMGELTVEAFDEVRALHDVRLPDDLEVGVWHLGVLLDPSGSLPRSAIRSDRVIAGELLVVQPFLRALTRDLPQARIGQSYCVVLEAEGGAGSYVWAAAGGSELPAGLALEELPAGAREAGQPFVTRLCGRPSRLGLANFALEISSAALSITQDYQLEVVAAPLELSIASTELPAGAYRESFRARLGAHGGTPPYGWALEEGRLPQGLSLGLDGTISGIPVEDGRFPLRVRVSDAAGESAAQEMALLIVAPTRLRCDPQGLPALAVGEVYDERLHAAGGVRPYRWQTVETRRLADGPGEAASSTPAEPPPGLGLSSLGEVSGAPSQSGRYLWTVAVSDSAQIPARDECLLVVDVAVDRGLTVSSRNLPAAVVGQSYELQLMALGGEGPLRWTLFEGNRLPEGMGLSPGGLIEGAPTLASLEGAKEWTFSFLVEVRDDRLRRGLAPLSLTVLAEAPLPPSPAPETSGGCGAATGSAGWLATALGIAFAFRSSFPRRRKPSALPLVDDTRPPPSRERRRKLLGRRGEGASTQLQNWAIPIIACLALGLLGCDAAPANGEDAERCGEVNCGQGTRCNQESGRCECSQSPDSCESLGKVCNSVGVCIDREAPEQVQPFKPCAVVGERSEDGSLLCHGPLANGANFWAPFCEESDDCLDPTTVCLKERSGGELPICWFNLCGDSEVVRDRDGAPILGEDDQPQRLNGESWGACDTITGRLEAGGSATGTCLPQVTASGVRHLCHASGRLEHGAICAGDAAKSAGALCEQGLGCRVIQPQLTTCWLDRDCDPSLWCNHPDPDCDRGKPDCRPVFCKQRPCTTREECGGGNFCDEGVCAKGGTCEGLCDGLGEAAGAYATCERAKVPEGQACIGNVPTDTSNLEALVAWCEEGACDVLEPMSCGDDARCEPKPNPQRPFGGSCIPFDDKLIAEEGTYCGGPYVCASGQTCKRVSIEDAPTESRCVRLCACEGGEGWDESARCRGSSPQCDEGQRCTQLLLGNDVLGACL